MTNDLIKKIHSVISEKSLLKHPFYEAWNCGELPIESMRKYAEQYYHFEKAYPRFLSNVHSRCDDRNVRQLLLENLWDEEHGEDNHVELWLRFCDALGLDRAQVENSTPDNSTKELIDSFLDLTSNRSLAGGASALFAFESQVPEVADTKIAGLKSFYGIEDKRGISFFKVHRDLDIEHSDAEAEMINSLVTTEQEENDAVDSADIAASSLWNFLDGVYK